MQQITYNVYYPRVSNTPAIAILTIARISSIKLRVEKTVYLYLESWNGIKQAYPAFNNEEVITDVEQIPWMDQNTYR